MGLESPINQGEGTLVDVARTLPAHPKWVGLGKNNLSATGLVVKEGATALVLGTDFEINYALGLLRATKAGAVADGGVVTVSASYNAVTGSRIVGNVQPEVKAKLILDGCSVI
ncbi:phage tail tube protein [Aeromonas encheleia]